MRKISYILIFFSLLIIVGIYRNCNVDNIATTPSEKEELIDYRNIYQSQNNDYQSYLIVDNYETPVVQTENNSYYLNNNFMKEYDIEGVPFIDYRNTISDNNIFIYGHSSNTIIDCHFNFINKFYEESIEINNISYIDIDNVIYVGEVVACYEISKYDTYFYKVLTDTYIDIINDHIHSVHSMITSNDKLITLYTCSNSDNNMRIVMHIKLTKQP